MSGTRNTLGRNLNALLGGMPNAIVKTAEEIEQAREGELAELAVNLLQSGKYQPRRSMNDDALEELAESIKAQGVIQPIVVRPVSDTQYEIIAGERRWRAAQLAGLDKVPAVIRKISDEAAIATALIENIQREDLNPIEESRALKRLQDEFALTHQEVADAIGKQRTTVTNLLRLMSLNDSVQRMLEHGDLDMGHARALLTLDRHQQLILAKEVVERNLTVRDTEQLIRKHQQKAETSVKMKTVSPMLEQYQNHVSEKLGGKFVNIQQSKKGKGKLTIEFKTKAELEEIIGHF